MLRFLIIITIIISSCSYTKLRKYESIVREADRFDIFYNGKNKTVTVPQKLINDFKDVLIRNINPEEIRKFYSNVTIDIYKNNQRTAFIVIANGKEPFANFNAEGAHFGFQLTYRIGMTIDNLYENKSPK